jgi:hypothetical protein
MDIKNEFEFSNDQKDIYTEHCIHLLDDSRIFVMCIHQNNNMSDLMGKIDTDHRFTF